MATECNNEAPDRLYTDKHGMDLATMPLIQFSIGHHIFQLSQFEFVTCFPLTLPVNYQYMVHASHNFFRVHASVF